MKITKDDLLRKVEAFSFTHDGDAYERTSISSGITEYFPNIEKFWKLFVCPYTSRIENAQNIFPRQNIHKTIKYIGAYNYTIFTNLLYAQNSLRAFRYSGTFFDSINSDQNEEILFFTSLSPIESFYNSLVSSFDLVFDLVSFLIQKIYLPYGKLDSSQYDSNFLKKLPKESLIKEVEQWYDTHYSKYIERCESLGVMEPLRIFAVNKDYHVYFKSNEDWTQFQKVLNNIKRYRNLFVHNIRIGYLYINDDGKIYLPNETSITTLKNFVEMQDKIAKGESNRHDYIEAKEMMMKHFVESLEVMNKIWEKLIDDFNDLMYEKPNPDVLKMYDIEY